jgi:hypothetical protein
MAAAHQWRRPTAPGPSTLGASSLAAGGAEEWTEALVVSWQCQECERDCVPCGDESRCICNHRFREHKLVRRGGREVHVCGVARCPCRRYFYHVTTGAWNCRCRCKHKVRGAGCCSCRLPARCC